MVGQMSRNAGYCPFVYVMQTMQWKVNYDKRLAKYMDVLSLRKKKCKPCQNKAQNIHFWLNAHPELKEGHGGN